MSRGDLELVFRVHNLFGSSIADERIIQLEMRYTGKQVDGKFDINF